VRSAVNRRFQDKRHHPSFYIQYLPSLSCRSSQMAVIESGLAIKFFTFLPKTLSNRVLPDERIPHKITIVDGACQL
jgi:hypothetical protein